MDICKTLHSWRQKRRNNGFAAITAMWHFVFLSLCCFYDKNALKGSPAQSTSAFYCDLRKPFYSMKLKSTSFAKGLSDFLLPFALIPVICYTLMKIQQGWNLRRERHYENRTLLLFVSIKTYLLISPKLKKRCSRYREGWTCSALEIAKRPGGIVLITRADPVQSGMLLCQRLFLWLCNFLYNFK